MITKRLKANVLSALAQVLFVGMILVLQYMFLARALGLEKLGAWALLVSLSNTAQVGQIGLSGTPVRFVSKYLAQGAWVQATVLSRSALISVAVIMAVILLAAYPLIHLLLTHLIQSQYSSSVLGALPLVLVGTWVLTLGATAQSCLDGCERIDLRALSAMTGSIVQFVMVIVLVPRLGLHGVAYALIAGNLTTFAIALGYCGSLLGIFRRCGRMWSYDALKTMFGYGVSLQAIGLAQALFLPTTKVLLAKFGNLSQLGTFEIANRVIVQVRQLLVAANRTLIPVFARVDEIGGSRAVSLFRKSYKSFFFLAFPIFAALAILSPTLSPILLGQDSEVYVAFSYLISIGYLLNSLSAPAYFSNLGTGRTRTNVIGHLATTGINAIVGFGLGLLAGGFGVVGAYSVTLAFGPLYVLVSYVRTEGLLLRSLFVKQSWVLALFCVGTMALGISTYGRPELSIPVQVGFVLIAAVWAWCHPIGRTLRRSFIQSKGN